MTSSDADLAGAVWRKSMRSNSGGNCVEVARNLPGVVAVRDSKHPQGPALRFSPDEWSAFLAALQAGEFSRLPGWPPARPGPGRPVMPPAARAGPCATGPGPAAG
jgi:hypothetical protein